MKNILLALLMPILFNGVMIPLGQAKEIIKPVVPCAHPIFRVLDFWVGDWMVYHRESDELAGFDRVGRILKGCAIQQSWISLDDHFSSPRVPFRMNGKSLTSFNGQQWVQFWVDNQAGSQMISGGLVDNIFILESEKPVMGFHYKLSWEPLKNGTLQHIARRKKTSEESWTVLFDFIYRRNVNGMILPQ